MFATPRRPLRCEQLEVRLALATVGPGGAGVPVTPVAPAHSSLPTAPATLYLDFNGHYQASWSSPQYYGNFSPGTTPAFDLDGNPAAFSGTETAAITEIWKRVAEDFAPFNINVTTVESQLLKGDPQGGAATNGKALRVVIGGSASDWFGGGTSGVAGRDSFTDSSYPNVGYVFSKGIDTWMRNGGLDGDGRPIQLGAAVATTASHEAGHAFGLDHQALYNADGDFVTEYGPGSAGRTPIMGNNVCSDRTTWHNGMTPPLYSGDLRWLPGTLQDDMAVIARPANGFGYRPDDHSNWWSGATALSVPGSSFWGSSLSGRGLIEKTTDDDWFKFTTSGGPVSLTVSPAAVGANLDAKIDLWRVIHFGGSLVPLPVVWSADPPNNLGETISTPPLAAGTYYVRVSSHGDYGDVGQYTVTGTGWFANPIYTPLPGPGVHSLAVAGTGLLGGSPAPGAVPPAAVMVSGGQPEVRKAVAVLPPAAGEDVRRDTGKSDPTSVPPAAATSDGVLGLRIQSDEPAGVWWR